MKIAVTGKGGSGKTTVAGTLARLLAQRQHPTVAIDCDPNPNLGVTVGLGHSAVESIESIFNGLLAAGYTHDQPRPSPEELLARFGMPAPDGVTLVATGRIEPSDACVCCGSHMTARNFFAALPAEDRLVVADLEAGVQSLVRIAPGPEDVVLAVCEPSARALEIARRACDVAEELGVGRVIAVANRCPGEEHRARVADTLGVEAIAIPDDPAVRRADRLGAAPVDVARGSAAVAAVDRLADHLLELAGARP